MTKQSSCYNHKHNFGDWVVAFSHMTYSGPIYIYQRQCAECFLIEEDSDEAR